MVTFCIAEFFTRNELIALGGVVSFETCSQWALQEQEQPMSRTNNATNNTNNNTTTTTTTNNNNGYFLYSGILHKK